MPYLATILITLLLAAPAMSVELFRYRGAAKDGGTLEYVFEAGEQNSPNAVTKEKAAEIAADFMTTFYHVQVGALETQEFRTTPVPFWLICFSDTIKGPMRQMFFVVLLPDGTVVVPRVAKRLLGLYIAKAALAAGHNVVATGRNSGRVSKAIGESANLLVVKLDVTNAADADSAAKAVIERSGRIDVLVNNAASFYAGYFEELTPKQMELQLATSLIGPMNVTRAFLPTMRKQRSGKIISISSSVGLTGFEYCTAYSASKFGLEGWMEALQAEVEPFGIHTMIVNPGFFRTELLTEESTNYAKTTIEDYKERNAQQHEFLEVAER